MFKKLKLGLILVTISALFLTFANSIAHADVASDIGEWLGDAFSTGEGGLTFAQYEGETITLEAEGLDSALTTSSDLKEFIMRIVNFVLGFLGLIAVIVVIYGGILYVTAAGEEEKATKGKKAIQYAATGLIIVMGSFAFVNTIILGAGGDEQLTGAGQEMPLGTTGGGFNASAEQVRTIAVNIYTGFALVSEVMDEIDAIRTDGRKESISPLNFPEKSEILTYLKSVQSKVNNINSKLPPFAESSNELKEINKNLELEIDKIGNMKSPWYYKKVSDTEYQECDPEAEGFEEGFEEGYNKENHCLVEGYTLYIKGLPEEWIQLQGRYGGLVKYEDADLYNIAPLVIDDYIGDLNDNLDKLKAIFDSVSDIQAIGSGQAYQDYASMMRAYGYQDIDNQITNPSGLIQELLGDVEWGVIKDVNQSGAYLVEALQNQAKLYEALKNVDYVQARLTANVVSGNAPLTVIFDTLGTSDPAGGSIQGNSITWDLAGAVSIEDLGEHPPPEMIYPENDDTLMTCSIETLPEGKTEEDYLGTTSKRCTFNKPGTYVAAIRVDSNDPTRFAPGISVLTIKVKPPTTKIELNLTTIGGEDAIPIMHYENDVLLVDKKVVTVTQSEADAGLDFDGTGTDADKYRWILGNGQIIEYTDNANPSSDQFIYENVGDYEFILEVLSPLGEIDRKPFTLKVAGIAARLRAPTIGAFINKEITFDGSRSKSDLGKISDYSWEINPSAGEVLPAEAASLYPFKDNGSSMTTIKHTFKYPVTYDITLSVTDSTGKDAVDVIKGFKVQSQEPVALFDYKFKEANQPGTVHFDGSKSYDPDGTDEYLKYEWSIISDEAGSNWSFTEGTDSSSRKPVIKFTKKGDYDVKLKAIDTLTRPPNEEYNEYVQTVTIDNVLDIEWDEGQEVTAVIDEEGKAKIDFVFHSDTAQAYEIDFGDGDISSGQISGTKTVSHNYVEGGKYLAKVTVYDEEDNDNSIQRRVFIGGGDTPIAKINIAVGDVNYYDFMEPLVVLKGETISFDASESKNTDGTGRKLTFSWDFGDGNLSSNKVAKHSYTEITPPAGFYRVTLTVGDKDEASLKDSDTLDIIVLSAPPTFSTIQALPTAVDGKFITPVRVNIKAFGADDPDGQITQYKWWYFDVNKPDDPLGIQITQQPNATLTIGTSGKEGEEVTYGFGLEVTDNDNLSTSTLDSNLPPETVTVENGPNDLPTAKFNVNVTKVFVGEAINFISASEDSDGQIVSYIWDVEGDGFFNNTPTDKAALEYVYQTKNLDGFNVKLKVVDDKGGEAISSPIKIYVDTHGKPPTAAFKTETLPGTNGRGIRFINNSKADEDAGANIISNVWDFDTDSTLTTADSDGDGTKNNDTDSIEKAPIHNYAQNGIYKIKLTITDNNGNTDEVINQIQVPIGGAPKADFSFSVMGNKAVFSNKSTGDAISGSKVVKYNWDFDTNLDTDNDGDPANDVESELKNPIYDYGRSGNYGVKLIILDDQGNIAEDSKVVQISGQAAGATGTGSTGTSGTGTGGPQPVADSNLEAKLLSTPAPDDDGVIYLTGEIGTIIFNFSQSTGEIDHFVIDKNIYFDSDENGDKTDDQNFRTVLPGEWTTNFEKIWGKVMVKLTVVDIYGNEDSVLRQIKFR
ncbi:PKD domain-containing protein [Patescibacteria group bacterium]